MKKTVFILSVLALTVSLFAQTDKNDVKTIHVFVALCDNKYQDIVPVPASIGNGQNPNSNLYWGCGYGIRTFSSKIKNGICFQPGKQTALFSKDLF